MGRWSRKGFRRKGNGRPVAAQRLSHPDVVMALTARLEEAYEQGLLTDVDATRIGAVVREAADDPTALGRILLELVEHGAAAYCHPSGQRDLPLRMAEHHLGDGRVRLGRAAHDRRNDDLLFGEEFAMELAMLRTSALVFGPPGSGKTRGVAGPVIEHLCLQSLAGRASVVVIDIKGDDFAMPGMFDIDIDLADVGAPAHGYGFDLYGGATSIDQAADRLASALLPPGVSADKAYFIDSSKNALFGALACYHAAHERYPSLRDLLALLRRETHAVDSVRARLRNKNRLGDYEHLLDARLGQQSARSDPAASLVERLGLLDRPAARALLDDKRRRFSMADINQPIRVRLAFPAGMFPDTARILTRLALAQFVQTAGSPDADTGIFKCLVIDEAGEYIDDYVARGVQRLRSANAGLLLLTQSLADLPDELRDTIFGSTNCKVVFGGLNPVDAQYLADYWGKHWSQETTHSYSTGESRSEGQQSNQHNVDALGFIIGTTSPGRSRAEIKAYGENHATREVERYNWSPSDIINGIPHGHALFQLGRFDGYRVPLTLVNLRA